MAPVALQVKVFLLCINFYPIFEFVWSTILNLELLQTFFLIQFVGYLFWPPSMVYISYSLYIVAQLTKGFYQNIHYIRHHLQWTIVYWSIWLAVFSVYKLISAINQLYNVTSFRCLCDISLLHSTNYVQYYIKSEKVKIVYLQL